MDQIAGQLASAVNVRALYPANHPRVIRSVVLLIEAVENAFKTAGIGEVTYILIGDDLVVGDELVRKTNLSVREFIDLMKSRGIERLTLGAGLGPEEAARFIGALATAGDIQSTEHIVVGRVQLVMEEQPKESDHRQLSVDQLEIVREAWARFRVERNLPVDQLEELVWSFIDSIARTTRAMLPLAPLKAHDEYTFVHSVNVSLLVLAQARSFGISGPMLHNFGMAGLLHDIGKMVIPLTVLNKPGKLDGAEWEMMKSHAREGAWYLSAIEGTPSLAVIVAFEHHLRVDGGTNYPVLRIPHLPNLASRMTAIADTYDAMMTIRPYQQPLGQAAAMEMLRKRAGSFYDPALVGNFIRVIETSGVATMSS